MGNVLDPVVKVAFYLVENWAVGAYLFNAIYYSLLLNLSSMLFTC